MRTHLNLLPDLCEKTGLTYDDIFGLHLGHGVIIVSCYKTAEVLSRLQDHGIVLKERVSGYTASYDYRPDQSREIQVVISLV